jgi:hypothetical protein
MFVLDTYHNFHNRVLNHAILAISFSGSVMVMVTLAVVVTKSVLWTACWLVATEPSHGMLTQWGTHSTLAQVSWPQAQHLLRQTDMHKMRETQ